MTFIIWFPVRSLASLCITATGTGLSGTGSACNITNGITLHPGENTPVWASFLDNTAARTCLPLVEPVEWGPVLLSNISSNNDRTVSGKAYAWRLLGMMPAISKAATVAQTTEWRAERRTLLYHSCIDILVEQINDLIGRDIQCTATMCPTTQCASCWCPRDQLQDTESITDQVFPFKDTQEIRAELETELARLLNQDGTARERYKDRVS